MAHGLFGGLFAHREAAPPSVMSDEPEKAESIPAAEAAVGPSLDVDRSFEYALDALPSNVMFCDRDLILRYLNRSSRKTLLTLQQYLPVPVDQIVGKSIHIFHKQPSQRRQDSRRQRPCGQHHLAAQGHHRRWGPSSWI